MRVVSGLCKPKPNPKLVPRQCPQGDDVTCDCGLVDSASQVDACAANLTTAADTDLQSSCSVYYYLCQERVAIACALSRASMTVAAVRIVRQQSRTNPPHESERVIIGVALHSVDEERWISVVVKHNHRAFHAVERSRCSVFVPVGGRASSHTKRYASKRRENFEQVRRAERLRGCNVHGTPVLLPSGQHKVNVWEHSVQSAREDDSRPHNASARSTHRTVPLNGGCSAYVHTAPSIEKASRPAYWGTGYTAPRESPHVLAWKRA